MEAKDSLSKLSKKVLIDKLEQLTESLKQERADAINSRNRFQKDKQLIEQTTKINIFNQLLPFLDNLDRALKVIPKQLQSDNWAQGIIQIKAQFEAQLTQLGIRPIEALHQRFDPVYMQAIASVVSKKYDSQTVVEELVKGYMIDDQVLRVSQVKVAK